MGGTVGNRQGVTKGKKKRKQKKTRRDRNHRTRAELCVEMLQLAASRGPDRQLLVTGDSAYG